MRRLRDSTVAPGVPHIEQFMMDVTAWLRELGLERYAQAFARQRRRRTDAAVQLTEADLAAIGVKSVGHRRRLVEAIAALGAGSRPLGQIQYRRCI